MANKPKPEPEEKDTTPKVLTDEALAKVMDKKYGKGVMTILSDSTTAEIVHWTSTGLYILDDNMGWGLPGGRIVEWFGAESSGKTTQLMAAFVENARRGGDNVVFDPEGTFNRDRYAQMGGDPSKLTLIDPGCHEEFYDKLDIVLRWARGRTVPHNACVLIGVDTITMLIPRDVLMAVSDDYDQFMGIQARINSFSLPKIDKALPPNTCLLLLSQVRDKMSSSAWGSADENIDTPGGRIIKHLSSVRVFFNKAKQIDNGKTGADRVIIGMQIAAKVVKDKIGPPLRKCEFRIMFDERGVDNVRSLLDILVAKKVMKQPSAGVYTIKTTGGEIKFKASEFAGILRKHPKLMSIYLDKAYELQQTSLDLSRY